MIKSRKAKRFVWVLSLAFGPGLFCTLLLTPPGMANIEAIKKSLIDLVDALAVSWAVGFGFVWAVYWLSKFITQYGPFV
jgi:hypothetical protein